MSLDQCVLVSMFQAFAAMGMHSVIMHAEKINSISIRHLRAEFYSSTVRTRMTFGNLLPQKTGRQSAVPTSRTTRRR